MMTEAEMHYGQWVLWTNKAGTEIPARIIDIDTGKDGIRIRVLHEGGAQQLWVRSAALAPLPCEEVPHA